MKSILNQQQIDEILNNIKTKNFSSALNKTEKLSENFPESIEINKLFISIYFNTKNWIKAIEHCEKILQTGKDEFKILTNIGVALFNLGKINQSIKSFKKAIIKNPGFNLAHNNLAISYLELGNLQHAITHFVKAIQINKNDLNAKNYLINVLNLAKPKNKNIHPIIKIDNEISKIKNKFNDENIFKDISIKYILEKSNKVIENFEQNIFLNETQIFRKNSDNLNCKRHFQVFNEFNVIPKYCFGCYKIQINLKTVVDLIKLFLIFDKIKLRRNNIRKCIIENRNKIQGNYKGYIYCKEIAEAEIIKKMINKMITQKDIGIDNITLKHGCSEFYESYPEFKKINPNHQKEMKYDNEWKSFEEIIDSRKPKRIEADKKILKKSIEGINLSDILIINNWISYAQIIGDESYKKVYDKKIENVFINKFLEDQLEFRKKELKI